MRSTATFKARAANKTVKHHPRSLSASEKGVSAMTASRTLVRVLRAVHVLHGVTEHVCLHPKRLLLQSSGRQLSPVLLRLSPLAHPLSFLLAVLLSALLSSVSCPHHHCQQQDSRYGYQSKAGSAVQADAHIENCQETRSETGIRRSRHGRGCEFRHPGPRPGHGGTHWNLAIACAAPVAYAPNNASRYGALSGASWARLWPVMVRVPTLCMAWFVSSVRAASTALTTSPRPAVHSSSRCTARAKPRGLPLVVCP